MSRSVAASSLGLETTLEVGTLDARRDWSFAGDVVAAACLMIRHGSADDYVVASDTSHSVRDLMEWAFECAGLDWRDHVVSTGALERCNAELHGLVGNANNARAELGRSSTMSINDVICEMVESDRYDLRRSMVWPTA